MYKRQRSVDLRKHHFYYKIRKERKNYGDACTSAISGTLRWAKGWLRGAAQPLSLIHIFLCNVIGQWVEDGEYPLDEKALEKIVKGICFDNAKRYFAL